MICFVVWSIYISIVKSWNIFYWVNMKTNDYTAIAGTKTSQNILIGSKAGS